MFKAVCREVENIFDEIGVEIVWTEGGSNPVSRKKGTPLALSLVLLPKSSNAWAKSLRVMGTVMPGPGPWRTVYIYLPDVLLTLGLSHRPRDCGPDAVETALALGKVAAHEVVHAVAPQVPHAPAGLMCDRMVRDFLVKRGGTLDPLSARGVLSRLRKDRLEAGLKP